MTTMNQKSSFRRGGKGRYLTVTGMEGSFLTLQYRSKYIFFHLVSVTHLDKMVAILGAFGQYPKLRLIQHSWVWMLNIMLNPVCLVLDFT